MAGLTTLILAAGQGTRMKSQYPKVLHPLLGRPMLQYVIDAARKVGADPLILVVGFGGERVVEKMGPDYQYVWQHQQLGTGHAVLMARELLAKSTGDLLVLYGDTPLLQEETLRGLVELRRNSEAAAAVLTTKVSDPSGYGRMVRDQQDQIRAIVEEKDATSEQRAIDEVNTGVYSFAIEALLPALAELSPRNAQGEYYLTDVIQILISRGAKVVGQITAAAEEVMGPNDRAQLATTEHFLKLAINRHWMQQGVSISDPDYTYISPDAEIGSDSLILPGSMILGRSRIGANCLIGPHTRIIDSEIGPDSEVQYSQVLQAKLGAENKVGPFAYVRPGTSSAAKVKIGDFVEIKNTQLGPGSKVPHLTYLGDTEVGAEVNIGAGTITCNYDGVNKHRTIIEDGAFIGSNANLVAPVVIGAQATVAAGSTITKAVPPKNLALARSKQENRPDWVSPRERAGK